MGELYTARLRFFLYLSIFNVRDLVFTVVVFVICKIVWRPGSSMWAGLSTKKVCVLLFTPPSIKHVWTAMTPDFEYLEKNREIVEVSKQKKKRERSFW